MYCLKFRFDDIAVSENVLGVQIEFGCIEQTHTQLRNSVFIPLFSQLPYAVVVRYAAPAGYDLISRLFLNRFIHVDGIFQPLVVEPEVEINAATTVVGLSHAASDHEVFNVVRLALLRYAVFHVFAERQGAVPRN